MVYRSAEEAKKEYLDKMGASLGAQYYALWQEITLLHMNWNEYVIFFGTEKKRVEQLNKAAPSFFRMVQDELWGSTLLRIARLLDSPRSVGKANLTVRNLTDLVDANLKMPIATLIDKASDDANFARDWRNRVIAHTDLSLALEDGSAEPLQTASKKSVDTALTSLTEVMNLVEGHYMNSSTAFSVAERHNGALSLVYLLSDNADS